MLCRLAVFLLGAQAGLAVVPHQQSSLLQTWNKALDASGAKDTPVTRVVNLLKEMGGTLQKEMDEDEALYDKLTCWCNNNKYEKNAAIEAATSKIAELKSTIESSAAHSAELKENIKEVSAEVAADKAALAEALAQREKDAKAFHSTEKESIANIESLTQAIKTLAAHAGSAFPQFSVSLLALGSHGKDIPWSDEHESSSERSFSSFMSNSGVSDHATDAFSDDAQAGSSRFLQKQASAAAVVGWSAEDTAVVRHALKSASAFVQQKHETFYAPASGEIFGVLKQLKDEMSASLSAAQSAEKEAAVNFNELRTAKTAEIENGERTEERKEDELAETNNILAEAKEDLDQTTSVLTADQKFMMNLKETCTGAASNFDARKASRLEEIKAVGETIEILTADEARDSMGSTFKFVQIESVSSARERAAAVLRKAGMPELSILATSVELDAFSRVKKAIDDMIAQLKTQQADEVKKSDWCAAEFQSNEMSTMKSNSLKDDQETKLADTASTLDKLTEEVKQAKADIASLQLELQRSSENRKQANIEFQKTVAEQSATQEVLKTALERLAKFYDASLAQVSSKALKQTPPVAEMSYEKSSGGGGVMQMIEKLVDDAKKLEAESRAGEQKEQGLYEVLVGDSNDSIKALQKLIVTKTSEKAEATQDKLSTESDLKDTQDGIAGLGKYNADLHSECDYIQKNFDTRQEARQQEVEALQQAKSILSGASSR